jgi:hypothetical protein
MNLKTGQNGVTGLCFVVLFTAFALISGALANPSSGKGGGGTTLVNVTSIVFDLDPSGAPLLTKSDDYNGSNEATYTYTSDKNIDSFIDSSGVWYLSLYPQKTGTRTVYVTPNDNVGAQPEAPPAGYYWKNVQITSKCTDSGGNTVPFPNLVHGSSECTFGLDFGYDGITYKLLLGRVLNASDPTPGKADVACNIVNSSNECVAWTITAGTGTSGVVANLYSYTGGVKAPWVFIGQYYNSVRVNVTNP